MRCVRALGIGCIQKGVFFLHDWERELCFAALGGWLRENAFFFFFFFLILSCCYSRQVFVTGAGWEGLQGLHRGLFGVFFLASFVSRFFNLGPGHLDS